MREIGLLITHEYKLLSVAAILDVLETVNKFHSECLQPVPFSISLVTDTGAGQSNPDLLFGYAPQPLHITSQKNLVLIPAFTTQDMKQCVQKNSAFIPWLRKQYEGGAGVASFCSGAFLFGATGLLNGKTATTHVDACPAFANAFPGVRLRADKTVTQGGRLYTSGGATSSFHLLLHLVQHYCGKDIAIRTAKVFAIDMDRHNQSYFSTFHPSRCHNDDLVATAQQKIEAGYNDVDTIEELIKDIPASRRNIVRRFKQVTGITPIAYLQLTRIEAAKKLLEQTSKQMTEIIANSGYSDPKAFRKIFRKTVGMTPSEYREKFQMIHKA